MDQEFLDNLAQKVNGQYVDSTYIGRTNDIATRSGADINNEQIIDVDLRFVADPSANSMGDNAQPSIANIMPRFYLPPHTHDAQLTSYSTFAYGRDEALEDYSNHINFGLIGNYVQRQLPDMFRDRLKLALFQRQVLNRIYSLDEENKRSLAKYLGLPEWRDVLPEEHTLLRRLCEKLNAHNQHVVYALGRCLGLAIENMFSAFPETQVDAATSYDTYAEVEWSYPDGFVIGDKYFKFDKYVLWRDVNGAIRQMILRYSCGEMTLFAYAVRKAIPHGKDTCCLGEVAPAIRLIQNDLLGQDVEGKVLLVLNRELLFALCEIDEDGCIFKNTGIIVSGNFAPTEAVASGTFSEVFGREVIILVTPGQPEWELLPVIMSKCEKAGALSVKCTTEIPGI